MPEAVIVAATRSPIGRAFKGSLTEVRPDDMGAEIIKSLLGQVPELDPSEIEDVICGNIAGAGEPATTSAATWPCWPVCPTPCPVTP